MPAVPGPLSPLLTDTLTYTMIITDPVTGQRYYVLPTPAPAKR